MCPSIMFPTSSMNSATNSFSFLILLPSVLLMVWSPFCCAQPLGDYKCNNNKNYSSDSAFAANLNTLLANIASVPPLTNSRGHFLNMTVGTKPGDDFVSGVCLCRGDLSPTDCRSSCMDDARTIRQVCPNQKHAIQLYRECIFRYSDQPIIGIMSSSPWFCYANQANSSDPKAFHRELIALLQILQTKVVHGTQYSNGRRRVSGSLQVYADLGCNFDLNASSCLRCFHDIFSYIPSCCYGKIGGAILSPSCDFRFETYQFYNLSDDSLPSRPPSSSNTKDHSGKKRKSVQIFVSIAISAFIAFLLLIGIWIFHRRRKAMQTNNTDEVEDVQNIIITDCLQFNFSTIKEATCDFSFNNKLGEGGFGEVYKGKLKNGQEVAVKRLSKNSCQGIVEFKTEVILVAKLQHKNLVKLLGFCMASQEKILVYEFLSNSSLDRLLFDQIKKASLDWTTRFKIILGIARGLLYLHEDSRLKVIHRDLKTSNILLDDLMNPKISDFGLAKLFGLDQTQGDTKRIVGTYGYMAPEYAITGQFSAKSDVFSFGVIVLEIVSARMNKRSFIEEALLHRAWRLWTEEKILDLVDPSLENNYQVEEVTKCIHIGLLSIQEDPVKRPTMSTIVRVLNGDTADLPTPNPPHLLYRSVDVGDEKPTSSSSYSFSESISGMYPR